MDSAVAFPDGGLAIDDHIGGSLYGRADDRVGADFAAVGIDSLCFISDSCASGHGKPPLHAMAQLILAAVMFRLCHKDLCGRPL